MKNNIAIVEGLLFLSGESGITMGELVSVLNIDLMEIENILQKIKKKYMQEEHGLELVLTSQSYKFATKAKYNEYFKKYANIEYSDVIPNSSMETLAIIAYNQPITKFDIEQIKGVSASYTLQFLQSKDLIHVVGRSDEIGKPNLYGVTERFYDYLGINTSSDLPELKNYELKDHKETQTDLFNDTDDFKEIRKRLLTELNFEERKLELEDDDVAVPTLKLFDDEFDLDEK